MMMTKKTIYYCDQCGKQAPHVTEWRSMAVHFAKSTDVGRSRSYDLCDSCVSVEENRVNVILDNRKKAEASSGQKYSSG